MKEIQLTQGYVALVDDEDYEELNKYRWFVKKHDNINYAARHLLTGKRNNKWVIMHRQITNCPPDLVVDHINHNGLDNRKENLRVCTNTENRRNTMKSKPGKCGYKGVSRYRSLITETPYYCQMTINGKHQMFGKFKTAEEAALAYDNMARKVYGEFAYLNFPEKTEKAPLGL